MRILKQVATDKPLSFDRLFFVLYVVDLSISLQSCVLNWCSCFVFFVILSLLSSRLVESSIALIFMIVNGVLDFD